MAAIILPSSILSNGSGTYIKTREILLQYFDIVAIAELGSGTFGKTGTNTITLFLRRKKTTPDTAEHYLERVTQWFDGDDGQAEYKDAYLIASYCAHIGVPVADYITLLAGQVAGPWLSASHFDVYTTAFNDSTEVKNLYKQKYFKLLDEAAQTLTLQKRYLSFVQTLERDKLYYFVLASDQSHPVLIIKSPSDTKAQKAFLGYDWSTSKGNEGIQLNKNAQGHHQTPMYDETNRNSPEKLSSLIADNFKGALESIPDALCEFAKTTWLIDILDFSRASFEKSLSLKERAKYIVNSKWPLVSLGTISTVKKGKAITQQDASPGVIKVVAGGLDFAYLHSEANRPSHTITVSASGANAGFVNFWREPIFASDCSTVIGKDEKQTIFLFHILKVREEEIQSHARGAAQPHVYPKDIQSIMIPVVEPYVQNLIITECETIDAETVSEKASISKATQQIISSIEGVQNGASKKRQLQEICDIKRGRFTHRPRNDPKFFGGQYPFIQTGDVVRAVASKVPFTQTLNEEGLAVSKLFQPPVVLVTIAANIGDTAVLDYPACFTDSVVGLTPYEGVNARFLELMMRTQKNHLNAIAPQMAQKNINVEILKPIKVAVPPLAEQEKLVREVEALEKTIALAQVMIDGAMQKKQAVMQRYL